MSNPVLVNTLRGNVVENRHCGAVVACDPRGRVVFSLGDIEALVYPRSSIKALQAIPLIETGAADHFAVSEAELALACSSHNSEPGHTQTVARWLQRIGLDGNALECGGHPPLHECTAHEMVKAGAEPARIHNNCSGKHTAMLCCAQHLGEPVQGYIAREHPTQQRWMDVLGDMGGVQMRQLPWNYDGCGIPVVAMPLTATATAFARFAVPDDMHSTRVDAVARISHAVAAHPFMVAGSGRLCTELMALTGRRVMIKTGADGVFTAALPERGLGIALKIDDGNREAAEVALLAVLRRFNALQPDEEDALRARIRMPIHNTRDVLTGHREAAAVWSMQAA